MTLNRKEDVNPSYSFYSFVSFLMLLFLAMHECLRLNEASRRLKTWNMSFCSGQSWPSALQDADAHGSVPLVSARARWCYGATRTSLFLFLDFLHQSGSCE